MPFLFQLEKQCSHLRDAMFVQSVKRLVQDQHLLIFHNRLRERESLPHPQTVFSNRYPKLRIQPAHRKCLLEFCNIRFSGQSAQDFQVLHAGIVVDESRRLDNDSRMPEIVCILADPFPVEKHLSGAWADEAADAFHQHRLSTAVVPDKSGDRPIVETARDSLQNLVFLYRQVHIFYFYHVITFVSSFFGTARIRIISVISSIRKYRNDP